MNTLPVLEIDQLAVAYRTREGEVEAVRDVSLAIRRGEAFGLVGESGCGKSTVAWAIVNYLGRNGVVKRGALRFLGQSLLGRSPAALRALRGSKLAMVYQDPMQALNPSMRLGEQLKEVLAVHRAAPSSAAATSPGGAAAPLSGAAASLSGAEAEARCLAMLRRVSMPDPEAVMRRYPHQISGGQQQRVVIAMALLNNPALLIMDEPTTALDVTVEAAVLDLVAELRRDFDTAILYITHNLGVVARICDRVGVMYAGELVEQNAVAALFDRPWHPYTQGLLRCLPRIDGGRAALVPIPGRVPPPGLRPPGCAFAPRCAHAAPRCEAERPALRELEEGAWARCHFAEAIAARRKAEGGAAREIEKAITAEEAPAPGLACGDDAFLRAEGLRAHYPVRDNTLRGVLGLGRRRYVRAVDGVSLSLPRGCVLGVVGESGCGKSTLARAIIGLERRTEGSLSLMGLELAEGISERSRDAIREVQMVFQNPDATLNPAYTVGYQIARPLRRFGTVPRGAVQAEVLRLLEAVRLGPAYVERYPRQLSGGERQRVGIARALASHPDLVLCDEPVSSLDVSVQAAILNLLQDLQRERGMTLLFIAHDLSVVRFISDFVAVMYLGEIVEIGPAEAIYAPPSHPYTEALLSSVPRVAPGMVPERVRLEGAVPSALDPPPGCRFHTRCPRRHELPDGGQICAVEPPPWREASAQHRIRCHLPLG